MRQPCVLPSCEPMLHRANSRGDSSLTQTPLPSHSHRCPRAASDLSKAGPPLGVESLPNPSPTPNLFSKLLLLLFKPLLYLFNGCLLALYLPLVEACEVLPAGRKQGRRWGSQEEPRRMQGSREFLKLPDSILPTNPFSPLNSQSLFYR